MVSHLNCSSPLTGLPEPICPTAHMIISVPHFFHLYWLKPFHWLSRTFGIISPGLSQTPLLLQHSFYTGFFQFLEPTYSLWSQDLWTYYSLCLHCVLLGDGQLRGGGHKRGHKERYRETKFIILTGPRETESPQTKKGSYGCHCQGSELTQAGGA